MKFPKFNLLLLFLILNVLLCCSGDKGVQVNSETLNSDKGISLDTLRIVYDGPGNFNLDYFPEDVIRKAKVKQCEIFEKDTISTRMARKVVFDQNGNIIRDENNFFSYWFEGIVRGTFDYQYNEGRQSKMIGIPLENNKDSVMTVWNYNIQGFLYSKDDFQFTRKLKPGADRHMPSPNDYANIPTWNKQARHLFSNNLDTIKIKTLIEDNQVNIIKYHLLLDSFKRLKMISKFENDDLIETTYYTYESNSITGLTQRKMNDNSKWTYHSKAVLNNKGKQIEKIVFNDDGTEKVKMSVFYNGDGTIKTIKYGYIIQEFKYAFIAK